MQIVLTIVITRENPMLVEVYTYRDMLESPAMIIEIVSCMYPCILSVLSGLDLILSSFYHSNPLSPPLTDALKNP